MTKLVDKNSCYINEQEFFSTSFVIFNICTNKLVNFANSVSNLCYIFENYYKIYQLVGNFAPNIITKRQNLLEEGENCQLVRIMVKRNFTNLLLIVRGI